MNKLTLQLRLRKADGSLLRVLSLTRRRRFEILSMEARQSIEGTYLHVQMTVEADRPGTYLLHQIEKLLDVCEVEVIEAS